MFLFTLFLLSASSDTGIWSEFGCTQAAPSFLSKQDLSRFLQSSHPISENSCFGTHQVQEGSPEQFHLFWECHSSATACLLPTVNVQALQTLLHFHPHSRIIVWSNTLQESLFSSRVSSPNLELKRYSQDMFQSLPEAAQQAYLDIPKFFESNVQSHSHFSDLFRLAVLWNFGGIYVDFDSLWVSNVGNLNGGSEWIPVTKRIIDGFPMIEDLGFLEGGIMKLEKNSPFAHRALQSFPKYSQEIAECWSCVGPKHITTVFIQLQRENTHSLPKLIDSSLVFGDQHYRANLEEMFQHLDPSVLVKAASSNAVAFHLFTSSGDRFPRPSSTIDFLFKLSTPDRDSATQYVPLGALSQRRRTEETVNSVDYGSSSTSSPSLVPTGSPTSSPSPLPTLDPSSLPTNSPSEAQTDAPIKQTLTSRFECDYQSEIAGREEEFKAKWKAIVGTTVVSLAEGSVIVEHEGTQQELQTAQDYFQNFGGVDLSPEFRLFTLSQDDTTESNSNATDSPSALANVSDGEDETNLVFLIFMALAGVLVVLGFYCIYRVWKGPPKPKNMHRASSSHVQYILNDRNSAMSRAPYYPNKNTATSTGYMQTSGYQKRGPQSSYIKEETGGYLIDGDDELTYAYRYNRHQGDADAFVASSYSQQPFYDYESGVIGGGHIEDAYGYRRDPRIADL